jgi:hypothetical protein
VSYKIATKGYFSCETWLEDSGHVQVIRVDDLFDITYYATRLINRKPRDCIVDSFEARSLNKHVEFKEHTGSDSYTWEQKHFCTLPAPGPWQKTEFSERNSVKKSSSHATGTEDISIRVNFTYYTLDALILNNQVSL